MGNPYLQVSRCQQYDKEIDLCPRKRVDRTACLKCPYLQWVQRNWKVRVEELQEESANKAE